MLTTIAAHTTRIGTTEQAAEVIRLGGVVAYPTESCFGLGCDPGNLGAVKRILHMKKRQSDKGVILIADEFERFSLFIEQLPEETLTRMHAVWPGPHTWLCPAKSTCSPLLKGGHENLAVRVTAHPPAARLAQLAGMAVVSTSANLSSEPALTVASEVLKVFNGLVDLVVDEPIGLDKTPSTIRNALSGEVIR